MGLYVCASDAPLQAGQACDTWIAYTSVVDFLQGFAITPQQAGIICTAIAAYLCTCYILKMVKESVK